MIRLAIMYWALKRSEFCKRHSTGTLTDLSGKISFILLKDWTFRKKADKSLTSDRIRDLRELFIGFATAHYKIVCFDIGVNPT